MSNQRKYVLFPRRLIGAAGVILFSLLIVMTLGRNSTELFLFGVTPLFALLISIRGIKYLESKEKPSFGGFAMQYLAFVVTTTIASNIIMRPDSSSSFMQSVFHVLLYGALLYSLLGLSILAKPILKSLSLRLIIVFLLASTINVFFLNDRGDGDIKIVHAIEPWLGFWPGIVEAGNSEILIDVPTSNVADQNLPASRK